MVCACLGSSEYSFLRITFHRSLHHVIVWCKVLQRPIYRTFFGAYRNIYFNISITNLMSQPPLRMVSIEERNILYMGSDTIYQLECPHMEHHCRSFFDYFNQILAK